MQFIISYLRKPVPYSLSIYKEWGTGINSVSNSLFVKIVPYSPAKLVPYSRSIRNMKLACNQFPIPY